VSLAPSVSVAVPSESVARLDGQRQQLVEDALRVRAVGSGAQLGEAIDDLVERVGAELGAAPRQVDRGVGDGVAGDARVGVDEGRGRGG
jgi:hypothetical protein